MGYSNRWNYCESDKMNEITERQEVKKNKILRRLLILWVVVFSALVILALVNQREASSQNKKRINEIQETQSAIQASRLESCKANYTSQLQAFSPFKPKKDDPTTTRDEVQDFTDFTNNLKKKRSHCAQQVAPKPVKPKEKK